MTPHFLFFRPCIRQQTGQSFYFFSDIFSNREKSLLWQIFL